MLRDSPVFGELCGQDNLSVSKGGGVRGGLDNDLTLGEGSGFCSMPTADAGSIFQKLPFPGSSCDRGTFTKYRFRDRLCRMEFCR
ncbi:hypothetical protein E2C01_006718 [Portunus trituberculatus]|uniref:Uncharacterized protein n=1 Tax=Portunus trituberculatus TaxID=210409 RepID=A0A5B7D0E9_PORTR|nr:hypothetical protein [Portunus trituberculatus]